MKRPEDSATYKPILSVNKTTFEHNPVLYELQAPPIGG